MFKIPHFINKYQDLEDHGLLWELIKMEIRAFTISYSKQIAKTKKDYEEDLIKEVSRLGNMVENYPSPETVQKYIKAENKLDKICYDRRRGACVRSKARWHEFGVRWPKRPISALGISFSYNLKLCEQENFLQKVSKIQKLFNIWSQRDLSLYGKVTITKTLGLSKLIFVSACIHTTPRYIDIINRLTTNFVWNNKKPKIKRDTLIGPKDRGGLDLPEFEIISKSLQTAWVKRMKNGVEDQWMSIPLFYLKNVGGPFIFDCDYDVKFLGRNNIPTFYTDVLSVWAEVREQTSDNEICVRNIILWNNNHILIEGKSVYWKEWHDAGVFRIKDLLDKSNRFITRNKFRIKTGLEAPFTKLFGLISAIPYTWKCALRPAFIMNNQDMEQNTTMVINAITSKKARNILI